MVTSLGPSTGHRFRPRRIAMLSIHTSPLDQPGVGDAGGMNVYIVELATRLARRGVEVEVFTRATSSQSPSVVEMAPGVLVRHVMAGPFETLPKEELPAQLCAVTSGVMRAEAAHPPGWYDVVHSHYWLAGQVGWLATERWGVPLVHSMHTMAKVKNLAMAEGDTPEPRARILGEQQVVDAATTLIANTDQEAGQLGDLYAADPDRVVTVPPGVDLDLFTPGDSAAARARLGLPSDAVVLLFAGRIQPLKGPDVLLRAVARLLEDNPTLRGRLVVPIVGGASGSGADTPESLVRLAHSLGIEDVVRFAPPAEQKDLVEWYRAADLTAVPSYNESFGLVAMESQACGTPVVAASVGGLRTAVADGVSGLLVDSHRPADWADALGSLLTDLPRLRALGPGAIDHAALFDWDVMADRMLNVYIDAMHRHRRFLEAEVAADAFSGSR